MEKGYGNSNNGEAEEPFSIFRYFSVVLE